MAKLTLDSSTLLSIRFDMADVIGRLKGTKDVIGMASDGGKHVSPEKLQSQLQNAILKLEKIRTQLNADGEQ